jgi:hypothetical protein
MKVSMGDSVSSVSPSVMPATNNKICIACKLLDECEVLYEANRPPCATENTVGTQPTGVQH